ncbi:MAG: EboA domain-containing protein [Nitrospirota bacterium]|nr:EboA domain-containing protein [Nitrospirota bacterium]
MPSVLHPHDPAESRAVRDIWNEKIFRESFAGASRRFGRTPLHLSDHDVSELNRFGVTWRLTATRDELGRIAMLIAAAAEAPQAMFQSVLQRCYDEGDARERHSILRALPLLPGAKRFLILAFEACRSHLQPLFEAIACDNPYPSVYFPDRPMSHMVLKALSLGTALDRIVGLERRMTPDLARMAAAYVSEQRAAGRSIPADVWPLLRQ